MACGAVRAAVELIASEPAGTIWANEFDNTANHEAQNTGTRPEIWEQTGGRIDGFVSAVGAGGTVVGAGRFLRERNPDLQIAPADPAGAALFT